MQQCIHPAALPQIDRVLFCQNAARADSLLDGADLPTRPAGQLLEDGLESQTAG